MAEVEAGLSLEMPGSGDYNRNKILEAVRAGRFSTEKLDEAVMPLLAVMLRAEDLHRPRRDVRRGAPRCPGPAGRRRKPGVAEE